jgi:hypothetical protein
MMENDSQNGRDIATKVVKIADELVSNRKDERLDFLAGYGMLSAAAKANHDVAPASLSVLRKMQSMNQCDAETLKDVAWACKEIALSIPKYTSEASEIILNGMQSDKNDDNDKGYKEPYGYGRVRNYVCSWFNAALYLRKLNPSIDQGLEVWKKASESGEYGSLIKTVDSHTLYLMAQAAPNQVFQLAKKELDPKNRKHNDVSEVIALTGISEAIKANPKLASKGIEIIRQSLPKAKKLADAFDVLREIGAANPEVGDQAIAAIEERLSKRKMDRMTTESALQNVMKIRDAQTRQEAGSRIERLRNRILAHDGENVSTPKPVKQTKVDYLLSKIRNRLKKTQG